MDKKPKMFICAWCKKTTKRVNESDNAPGLCLICAYKDALAREEHKRNEHHPSKWNDGIPEQYVSLEPEEDIESWKQPILDIQSDFQIMKVDGRWRKRRIRPVVASRRPSRVSWYKSVDDLLATPFTLAPYFRNI